MAAYSQVDSKNPALVFCILTNYRPIQNPPILQGFISSLPKYFSGLGPCALFCSSSRISRREIFGLDKLVYFGRKSYSCLRIGARLAKVSSSHPSKARFSKRNQGHLRCSILVDNLNSRT